MEEDLHHERGGWRTGYLTHLLLRRHADADEGYIYGFRHPDDTAPGLPSPPEGYGGGPDLIKIGRSKNHQARMRQISRRCGYVPHTVFAHLMPQHARVERVVHALLHNSRLRDVGCGGCGARHEEWFQVGAGRAEHLVALWKAFVECRPYDEQGQMLPAWRERLERLDLGDVDCWEHLVHAASLAQPVAGSPQELEAEGAPARLVGGRNGPSSDGDPGRDDQEESWEVV
ncbi:putative importin 13 [Diaporthe ampelina]|uniref:Putative importin 13 n=1 Tax=Diaporthe ampelina TaxID=1214573 RepID=A0A0G2FJH6_9PEZI|nr:putative importin 13 [Diaporthe ampelina]